MKSEHFTRTFTVDRSPQEVFSAINDVRAWWTGAIEGTTDALGAEFTYRYEDLHRSTQKVTELVPGKTVVWTVLSSSLEFLEKKSEWTGTTIRFDLAERGGKTEVRFTHVGLSPERECYSACSKGWSHYVKELESWIARSR